MDDIRQQATGGGGGNGDEPSSINKSTIHNAETYQRSYNHLINEQADDDIFHKVSGLTSNFSSRNRKNSSFSFSFT